MSVTERLSSALAGRYKIESRLGEGGMATVYLAEDLKHKRKVALKVLKPDLAAVLGAERFVQEITTTASLQHPHILPLFDSGTAGETDGGTPFLYYVMPYIEGETLRDKLDRETQLSVDESVKMAGEVLDALQHAHEQGVIHRDIKPENILLQNGRPMVADFGIALAVSAAAGGRMTETGLSLGTPHYMSPEQATAEKDLSARSDVYSVGSVLYEMLTGSPPHVGASAQQIIMKIVTEEAQPVTALRKSVPPNVAAAVAKSLEKLPADRFETAATFATALANPAFAPTSAITGAATVDGGTVSRSRWMMPIVVIAGVLLAVAVWKWPRPEPKQVVRVAVTFADGEHIVRAATRRFAISPDGSRIVYVGPGNETSARQLWVRRLDQLEARPIPGTDSPGAVFFSPDGQSVGFVDGQPGDLKIVPVDGGPVRTLANGSVNPWGGFWGSDGWVYFSSAAGQLTRVLETGGPVEVVIEPDSMDSGFEYDWPEVLPNGNGLIFQIWRSSLTSASLAVLDLETREIRDLGEGVYARYLSTGHLLYITAEGSLFARPFDDDRLEFTGEAVPLESQIRTMAGSGVGQFDVSQNGHFIYQAGAGAEHQIVRVDRSGVAQPVDASWRGTFRSLALSPDGTRLAMGTDASDGGHIWVKELDDGPQRPVTFGDDGNDRPAWTPDGRSVTYARQTRVFTTRADGGGRPEEILLNLPIWEVEWSRDGTWLVLRVGGTGTGTRDVHALRPGVDSVPRVMLATPAD
jgi:serine/threonine-protein kinase